MRVDLAAVAPARRRDDDARLADEGGPIHLGRHSTQNSDAARNPIERSPPAGAVERRPDDLGSDRPIVVGERLVRRLPIRQDGLPGNAFGEDAKPVARRAIRPAGEAGAKRVPVGGESRRRLGGDSITAGSAVIGSPTGSATAIMSPLFSCTEYCAAVRSTNSGVSSGGGRRNVTSTRSEGTC